MFVFKDIVVLCIIHCYDLLFIIICLFMMSLFLFICSY